MQHRAGRARDEPPDTDGRLREWMVASVACVLRPGSAVYVSTPITTGARYVAWRRGPGAGLDPDTYDYRRAHHESVVAPNRAAVAALVHDLRRRLDDPVVDPTALEDVPGWQQFDYHRYWVEVIETFAHTVRLAVDGWEYSSGCVLEVAAAVRGGLTLHRPDGSPLTVAEAGARVAAALDDVRSDGVLPVAPLEQAVAALERAGHGPAGRPSRRLAP